MLMQSSTLQPLSTSTANSFNTLCAALLVLPATGLSGPLAGPSTTSPAALGMSLITSGAPTTMDIAPLGATRVPGASPLSGPASAAHHVDAGLSLGRSFRVGWGPGGMMAVTGAGQAGGVVSLWLSRCAVGRHINGTMLMCCLGMACWCQIPQQGSIVVLHSSHTDNHNGGMGYVAVDRIQYCIQC